jgi:LPS sulfotransferase NodH
MMPHRSLIRSILIAGVQRSGTSLLCEGLKAVGNAGWPDEYFLSLADSEWIRGKDLDDIRRFVGEVLEAGTTQNGTFGINIMWNTHCGAQERLRTLPEFADCTAPEIYRALFPDITYVWIRRRDRVRQAVSWAKAAQTGLFKSNDPNSRDPKEEPKFDFQFIDNLHGFVREGRTLFRTSPV